jgi:ankyrin repeat protein
LKDLVADINTKGLDNWTALHFAANEGYLEIVKELLTHSDIEKEPLSTILRAPLHLAASRGHTNIARALIQSGADKNVKDFDENTPMHHASEFGHMECIIYLVKEGDADPFQKNKYGYTPSDIAQNYQVRQLFEKLIPSLRPKSIVEETKSFYGRTAVNGVLRHNDRISTVNKLMHTY